MKNEKHRLAPFFRFFAERHSLANIIIVMIVLLGGLSFSKMKKDTFPAVEFGEVIINTEYPGASPEDVEINVTNKLEDELESISEIKSMSSSSKENQSQIHLVLFADADSDKVIDDIKSAVDRVTDLPPEVTKAPDIIKISTEEFPVIEVGLIAPDTIDYKQFRFFAKDFEKKLKALPGISDIIEKGMRDHEVRIEVYPEKLKALNMSVETVIQAIGARNIRGSAGTFESYTNEKSVVTLAQFKTPEEVSDVIIRSTFDGKQIKVKDVANVSNTFKKEKVLSRMNGKNSISFIVKKSATADVIKTVDAVKNLIEETKKIYPSELSIEYANDNSKNVRNRLSVVASNAIMGLIFVMIVLKLFFNFSTAFWVSMGIPTTLFGVFLLMPAFDAYIEVVSLAAFIIILGIIVDDAIIISENIASHRENGEEPLEAAVNGISEVAIPVLSTILTTFIAFSPMFFMTGIMGKFIFSIPLVVSLALFFSFVEVSLALPAHLIPGLKNIKPGSPHKKQGNWFDAFKIPFERFIKKILHIKWLLVSLFLIAFISSIFYAKNYINFILFPSSTAEVFHIYIELPQGNSLQSTSDKTKEIEHIIKTIPSSEMEAFTTRIGESGHDITEIGENLSMIQVSLTPSSKRDRTAEEIVNELRESTNTLTGFKSILYQIESGGPPVGKPIEIQVIGDNDSRRKEVGDQIYNYLKSLPEIIDLERDDKPGKEQVEIDINFDDLAALGLKVSDIARSVRVAFDGEDVTTIRYNNEDYSYKVIYNKQARKNMDYLKKLTIPNASGKLIQLKEVANLIVTPGPSAFYHYDGSRSLGISSEFIKGEKTVVEITNSILDTFQTKENNDIRLIIEGESAETQQSMLDLSKAFIIAGIGIFLILILLFDSFIQPIIVLVAIPFGLIGVIIAFALHHEPLGFIAMMGVIGMTGVVVNDSLVLVDHLNELIKATPDGNLIDLIASGTANRLRPIIITTLTTVAGLLPLAYGLGGSDPFMAPMALALGYGLLFSSILILILVPCLYLIIESIRHRFGKKVN